MKAGHHVLLLAPAYSLAAPFFPLRFWDAKIPTPCMGLPGSCIWCLALLSLTASDFYFFHRLALARSSCLFFLQKQSLSRFTLWSLRCLTIYLSIYTPPYRLFVLVRYIQRLFLILLYQGPRTEIAILPKHLVLIQKTLQHEYTQLSASKPSTQQNHTATPTSSLVVLVPFYYRDTTHTHTSPCVTSHKSNTHAGTFATRSAPGAASTATRRSDAR